MEIQFNKPYLFTAPGRAEHHSITFTNKGIDTPLSNFIDYRFRGSMDDGYWTLGKLEITNIIYIIGPDKNADDKTLYYFKNSVGGVSVAWKSALEKMIEVGFLRFLDSHEEIGYEYGLL